MSNQPPPSFGGHSGYTQQWPPFPSMIPSNFAPNPGPQTTAPPPLVHPPQAFEYNLASVNANSRNPVPGNPGDQGIFLPPHLPFMGPFDLSQFPLPFPPMPMSSFGFPSLSAPPGPLNVPSESAKPNGTVANQRSNSQRLSRDIQSMAGSNREEGEVSEGEVAPSISKKDTKATEIRASSARQPSLVEEETGSSPSSTSTRSSSPYNPPLSVSADADAVNHAIELQKQDVTRSDASPPLKTAAQLRVQAQGALLSLAPHNIRYNELVAEGINPAILQRLYEEVGIRVATPQPTKPAVEAPVEKPASSEPPVQAKRQAETTQPDKIIAPQPPTPSAAQPVSGKPMERKELIAKMLAAKAAKASSLPVTPKEDPADSQPATTAPSPSITPLSEKTKENGAPVKEKNKAQTELARQRIEALKKQALLKSQQKAQQLSQASPEDQPLPLLDQSAPVVHHPLPVRPPAPHPSEPAGIPGLSLTDSAPNCELQASNGGPASIAVDSTPLARVNQRKRPRACDFDDAEATQNKHIQADPYASRDSDKLIIHISDDESLYGDDEDEEMDVDSTPDQNSTPVTISAPLDIPRPPLQRTVSGARASTSTPQAPSRPGDQQQMRQKALEIQALHKKIAELEERRKAKLAASRTQSPRTLEDSAASPSAPVSAPASAAASTHLDETPTAPPATDVEGPNQARTTLTAADMDEIYRQADLKKQPLVAQEASTITQPPTLANDLPVSSANAPAIPPAKEEVATASASECSESDFYAEEPAVVGVIHSDEPPAVSQPDSIGSVLDESEDDISSSDDSSVDSSSGDSTSDESGSEESESGESDSGENLYSEEMQTSDADNNLDSAPTANDQMQVDSVDHPLPGRDPISAVESNNEDEDDDYEPVDSNVQEGELSEAEYSSESDAYEPPESDAYEPPEPDTGAESPHSAYSPPPPASVEEATDLDPSPDVSRIEEPLTEAPRVNLLEARPVYRGSDADILGIKPSSNTAVPKFSPYVSPLRYFKAYRYHPRFTEEVSDGYRSLTYSHDIDSMKYLCPFELAGGVCNDRSCEFQHFRDMSLSDDKILIQMGSVREGQTEEEKATYLAGLKEIINEMRRDKVKEFSTVASEIAAYRSRFLQDPSRVLPL